MTRPKLFEKRIRSEFLWWPKTINEDCRWLTHQYWEEKFGYPPGAGEMLEPEWYPTRWLNDIPKDSEIWQG